MINAIAIQNYIIKTENILEVKKHCETRHNASHLEIKFINKTMYFYYRNNDDMLTDFYRILSALNGIVWSKKDE